MLLGALLPLGVVAQIVLGGFTVLYDLAPGLVMSHYILSMLILVACVRWTGARIASRRPPAPSAARPARRARHLGAAPDRRDHDLRRHRRDRRRPARRRRRHRRRHQAPDFKGADTLNYVIEQHARLATAARPRSPSALWVLARRRGATREQRAAADVAVRADGAQGVIGGAQYVLELPAEIVWVHVCVAAVTWLRDPVVASPRSAGRSRAMSRVAVAASGTGLNSTGLAVGASRGASRWR